MGTTRKMALSWRAGPIRLPAGGEWPGMCDFYYDGQPVPPALPDRTSALARAAQLQATPILYVHVLYRTNRPKSHMAGRGRLSISTAPWTQLLFWGCMACGGGWGGEVVMCPALNTWDPAGGLTPRHEPSPPVRALKGKGKFKVMWDTFIRLYLEVLVL